MKFNNNEFCQRRNFISRDGNKGWSYFLCVHKKFIDMRYTLLLLFFVAAHGQAQEYDWICFQLFASWPLCRIKLSFVSREYGRIQIRILFRRWPKAQIDNKTRCCVLLSRCPTTIKPVRASSLSLLHLRSLRVHWRLPIPG